MQNNASKVMDCPAIILKVGVKALFNFCLPGSGSVFDFSEAVYDVYQGNNVNAALNFSTGVYDLFLLGCYGAVKEAAKVTAKQTSMNAAMKACKESSKKIGEEASKMIAQGVPKKAAVEFAKLSAKNAKEEIYLTLLHEVEKGLLSDVTAEAFKEYPYAPLLQNLLMKYLENAGEMPWLEGATESIIHVIDGCFAAKSRKDKSYSFRNAALTGAKSVASTYFIDNLKRDLAFNLSKGFVKHMTKDRTKVPEQYFHDMVNKSSLYYWE